MKLRNKLIPMISVATVAATIAPITACTTSTNTVVDLMNGYTPSIKKAVWEDYRATKADMLAFYASAVNENPEIFAQDLLWKFAVESFYELDTQSKQQGVTVTAKACEAYINNIEIKKLTCFYDDEIEGKKDVTYYTISCDFQLRYAYEVDGSSAKISSDVVNTVSMKNIPFTINREGTSVAATRKETQPGEIYSPLENSFVAGSLPTSWVVQPILIHNRRPGLGGPQQYQHEAFDRLTNNGYEWFVKANIDTATTTTPYSTKEPTAELTTNSYSLKELEQFDNAEKYTLLDTEKEKVGYLDWAIVQWLSDFYVPSFYLSDIEDTADQLWKIA